MTFATTIQILNIAFLLFTILCMNGKRTVVVILRLIIISVVLCDIFILLQSLGYIVKMGGV